MYLKYFLWISWMVSMVVGCNRKPLGATGERSPVDDSFQILIDGNPSTYIPGQQYNVTLSCASGVKFVSFTLIVEGDNNGASLLAYDMLGHFELLDVAETKFSLTCENMIESTNTNVKSKIDVAWVAPTNPDSGCVTIKAAVVQHRNVWFIDDGFLSKRICPEEIDEVNSQTPLLNPCCACDEAKYEIILERRWTRNTHAKDFPSEVWRTRFTEIIGASHTFDFRFWEYGNRASQGLREMAEHGATRTLEDEIKAHINTGSIRTIIKAPGIIYRQNIYGITLANVRVDPQHHLISLVTKIFPSPDWILGVAGLELCLMNCTWIDRKVLNLYPWDIGTDSGPSYMSPDQPQVPPDVIRRITSTFPSDHRSPFYDESGAPMKPLATLHITRRKLYERVCNEDENIPVECGVHPWNNWSECSSKCGPGVQYRQRAYKDERLASSFKCQMVLQQQQNCIGEQCGEQINPISQTPECELGMWSAWSSCSKRCGKGFATRTREYRNPYNRDKCQSAVAVELEQRQECLGEDCGGSIRTSPDNYDIYRRPPMLEEFEEPGLMEENMYQNSGRFGGSSSYQPSSDVNTRYPSTNPQDEFVPQENIYGSDKFTGRPSNVFNRPYKTDSDGGGLSTFPRNNERDSQVTGSLGYDTPRSDNYPNLDNFNKNQYGDVYTSVSTTRSPFSSPAGRGSNYPKSSYPGYPYGSNDLGDYNSNQNSLDVQTDNGYAVVQEYCFQKPIASEEPCSHRDVIVSNYWFYDSEDQECKIFTTDNCDQNRNRFRTLEACEGTCHKPQFNSGNSGQPDNAWDTGFGEPMSQTRSKSSKRRNYYRRNY